jgi:hypothetical protein
MNAIKRSLYKYSRRFQDGVSDFLVFWFLSVLVLTIFFSFVLGFGFFTSLKFGFVAGLLVTIYRR